MAAVGEAFVVHSVALPLWYPLHNWTDAHRSAHWNKTVVEHIDARRDVFARVCAVRARYVETTGA